MGLARAAPGSSSGSAGVSATDSGEGDLEGIGVVDPEEDSVGCSKPNRSARKSSKAAWSVGLWAITRETFGLTALGWITKADPETAEEPAAEVEAAWRSSAEIGKNFATCK